VAFERTHMRHGDQGPSAHRQGPSAHDVQPPQWAEAILRLLLGSDDAETVSGDLLEEYREAVRPTSGRLTANLWYVRQVAGFAWRATGFWGVLVGLTAPTSFPVFTAWSLPLPAVCLLLIASSRRAYRTRSVRTGVVIGCVNSLLATVVALAVLLVRVTAFHPALETGQAKLPPAQLHESSPLVSLVAPMLMFIGAAAVGSVGAIAGKVVRSLSHGTQS
jgi:hypothetical protein